MPDPNALPASATAVPVTPLSVEERLSLAEGQILMLQGQVNFLNSRLAERQEP